MHQRASKFSKGDHSTTSRDAHHSSPVSSCLKFREATALGLLYGPFSSSNERMTPIEIISTLTAADWRAYQMAWAARMQRSTKAAPFSLKTFLIVAFVSFALATVLSTWVRTSDGGVPIIAFVLGAALAVGTMFVAQRRLQKNALPDSEGTILGQSLIRLEEDGIHIQKQGASSTFSWTKLQSTTLTTEHLFLWVDRVAGLIVPLRDLPSGLTPSALNDEVARLSESSARMDAPSLQRSPRQLTVKTANADSTEPNASWSDFARACVRLWTLRTVAPDALNLPDRISIVVVIACFVAMFATDWTLTDASREFAPYGVLACCWYGLAMLFVAWVSGRVSEPKIPFWRVAALIVVFLPIAVIARLLFSLWPQDSMWLMSAFIVTFYAALILERGVRSLTMRAQPWALVASMLLATLIVWPGQQFYLSTQFFYPNPEADGDLIAESASFLEHRRAAEATLFAQANRIQDEVDAFDVATQSMPRSFFIGFAGMGEQRVFAGEIALAEQVIGKKFGTQPWSITLVNDRRDLHSHPLASPTALRYTLAAVAEKMDTKRDVLFLSLSSHGSPNGELSVSNWGLPLNNLSARELAAALDESGIQWRVIIVSACYAGTFIEPLRNDNTIVIAASAADRTSFGCSDDRDLTYFGEAFYRDALSRAPDLRQAFETAQHLIAEREALEEIEPSKPEAHFGPAIEAHLRSM